MTERVYLFEGTFNLGEHEVKLTISRNKPISVEYVSEVLKWTILKEHELQQTGALKLAEAAKRNAQTFNHLSLSLGSEAN